MPPKHGLQFLLRCAQILSFCFSWLQFPTRDGAQAPVLGARSLGHCTTRELPAVTFPCAPYMEKAESTKMVFTFQKNPDVSSLVFLVIILVILKPD